VIRVLGQLGFPYRELHFSPLLEAFTLAGEMDKAFEIFSIMRNVGVIPKRHLVTPVARAFGQDTKAAMRAKECLDKRREEGRDVDIVAFNLVLHVLSYNGHNEEAYDMFERHKEYNVTPDTETLDAVLDSCIHLKDLEKGQHVYKELNVQPTSTTLSKMVALACTQEDYQDAFHYLEEMKHRGLTPLRGCYYKLVKTLSGAQDSRLQMALDDMEEYGYEISSHLKNYMLLKREYFEEQQRREQYHI
jgi:pentatricopeptide repeat protein